jgi:hypothetical protein
MIFNKAFKTSNAIICINFPQKMVDYINNNDGSNLTNIHIIVFDTDDVQVDKLLKFVAPCRRRKIKIIIHCFNKKDISILKHQMKGVKKDSYFHFQYNSIYKISMSKEKQMLIEYKKITFITNTIENKNEIQEIYFKNNNI